MERDALIEKDNFEHAEVLEHQAIAHHKVAQQLAALPLLQYRDVCATQPAQVKAMEETLSARDSELQRLHGEVKMLRE